MKFQIGDKVVVKKTKDVKNVEFSEIICSEEIYYMTDNTSYHVDQIEKISEITENEVFKKIIEDESLQQKIIKDYISNLAKRTNHLFK